MFHGRISLTLVLLLLLVNFVGGFRLELMYIYIPHHKYQVQPHSSPWFSAACTDVIVHRNYFFCLYQQNKSSESKVKFRQASNCCERVLELPNLHMLIKQKSSSLPRNLALGNFGKLPKEFCFPCCWKVSLVVPVFKNVGERSIAKNYHPVSPFLWLVKSLKNL